MRYGGQEHAESQGKDDLEESVSVDPYLLSGSYSNGDTLPRSENMLYAPPAEAGGMTKKRPQMNETNNRISLGVSGSVDSWSPRESSSRSGFRSGSSRDWTSSSGLPADMTNEELRNEVGNLRRDLDRIRWQGLLDSGSEAPPSYVDD